LIFLPKKIKKIVFANFFSGGWEVVTGALVKQINRKCEGIVFMLWGNKAILKNQHLVNIFDSN
jgi:uracil DNA glycosylase